MRFFYFLLILYMSTVSVIDKLYEGSAELGLFYTKIMLYGGFIFAAIMILIGLYLFIMSQNNLIDTTAIITKATWQPVKDINNKIVTYDCQYDIKYIVN